MLPHLNEALPVRALELDDNEQAARENHAPVDHEADDVHRLTVAEDGFEDNPHLDAVSE